MKKRTRHEMGLEIQAVWHFLKLAHRIHPGYIPLAVMSALLGALAPFPGISIVGRNGAGKTTFIKLLCRLYRPEKGCILLNGVDINTFEERAYAKCLSVLFQDYKIFSFSVKENLAFQETADEERIRVSLGQAGILEKVEELPLGLDTPL